MKRVLLTTLQVFISAALIIWIFRSPEQRAQMAGALRTASLSWFVPGLAAMGAVILVQALRWHLLLRAIGIPIVFPRTARLYMIGAFFNLFLLGATGGDVVKVFYAIREAGQEKAGAFLSIVLDRVIGLLALALVSGVVIAMHFGDYMATPIARGLLLTIGLILGGGVGVVAAASLVALLKLEKHLPARMPLRRAIVDLAIATQKYSRSPGALAGAFALSIAGHLFLFATFYFAARAFTDALSFGDVLSVMPVVSTITSVPISLGGIGIRESIFQTLLDAFYSIPASTAALVSMGGYLISVAWALAGGAIYLTYRPSTGSAASIKEMSAVASDAETRLEDEE